MQARIRPEKKHQSVDLPGLTVVLREWTEIPPIAEQAAREHPYLEIKDERKPRERKAGK